MKGKSGFTLLELMVTVAIIGILATMAIPAMRAATRNASVSSLSFELQMRLQGLKPKALADQETYLAVFVDAPANSGAGCTFGQAALCARFFVLRNPQPAWTLNGFDPGAPALNADLVEVLEMGRGIRFALEKAGTPAPAPFTAVRTFDPAFTGNCGGRTCMAFRFAPSGMVSAEGSAAPAPVVRGAVFGLGTELTGLTRGAENRAVFVSVPSGIVKSYGL